MQLSLVRWPVDPTPYTVRLTDVRSPDCAAVHLTLSVMGTCQHLARSGNAVCAHRGFRNVIVFMRGLEGRTADFCHVRLHMLCAHWGRGADGWGAQTAMRAEELRILSTRPPALDGSALLGGGAAGRLVRPPGAQCMTRHCNSVNKPSGFVFQGI